MVSLKGILKYSVVIFIAAWMFILGIMVGRGNSPVTFDTRGFEQQLGKIVGELGSKKDEKEEVNLEFFDVLDQPVAEEKVLPKVPFQKNIPEIKKIQPPVTIPMKVSTKRRTFKKKMQTSKSPATQAEQAVSTVPARKTKSEKKIKSKKKTKIRFTIQVAAYKNFTDAVNQMTFLEKKESRPTEKKGEKDGITWYRVRTGAFQSFEEAKEFKEKLNQFKIKAMIIKKDSDENIKR